MDFENMPHKNLLTGLLKNLIQAQLIISKHPLDSLPEPFEEVEEDLDETTKKKKILQTIIGNEDEKKLKFSQSEAFLMMQRVSSTPSHRLKNVMFKKMLLKLILLCYDEKFKEKSTCENFCDFVFSILLKKYMMRKAAESKYHHLLASCVKYKSISRVRVFARFLGLYNAFDLDDLSFYMESYEFLQNSPSGVFNQTGEGLEIIYVPYIRCVECIKYYEKNLPKSTLSLLRMKLEKMRKIDKSNRLGVVDIDEFLEQLVETYNDFNKSTKDFMKCIYEAADLNDDGYLQYKEFELLLRFVSQVAYSSKLSLQLFEEFAENFLSEEDDEVKAISFENLCQMNKNYKVFTENSIHNVTGINSAEAAAELLEKIQLNLEDILAEFMWRFSETLLWEDHIDEIKLLLSSVKEKIESKKNQETAYLAFRLIDLESKRILVEERLEEFLPDVCKGFNAV